MILFIATTAKKLDSCGDTACVTLYKHPTSVLILNNAGKIERSSEGVA